MSGAGILSACLLGFIQGGKKQDKECHIVVNGEPGQLSMPLLKAAAEPTITGFVAPVLLRAQGGDIRRQISKNGFQLLPVKELPQRRQTILIFPWPLCTLKVVLQEGQTKNL